MAHEGISNKHKRFADDPEWGVTRGLPPQQQQRLRDELQRVEAGGLDIDDAIDPDQLRMFAFWKGAFDSYESLEDALFVVDELDVRSRTEFDIDRERIKADHAPEINQTLTTRYKEMVDSAESAGTTVPHVLKVMKGVFEKQSNKLQDQFESLLTMNLNVVEAAARDVFGDADAGFSTTR